ncbi:hypothetical protein TVAG_225560 [Trichomonas vaginalis G3]|uniref:Uncharacterized protein n=1 Tax=Trichomonas vaginalis (strain ATCC PRA-98 / G3) TaxID=412133 RepID=A2DNT5_TRIV3|nr:hypothetical protein TVAGG3_0288960 [Trichomonas vaginalis G3]EAY17930.1 hypothetical protein TVAG_225560 [Trichomonas vaginalis G3]KAI5527107.1 hypothetical protein TVAGG3_0288960 [Trichomonas vaginalis G3]|eukprot:XP_001578916.1 hypothetical protein [Trichomonas vaginalis G3]
MLNTGNIRYIVNEKEKPRFDIKQAVKDWWIQLDNKNFGASRTSRIVSCSLEFALAIGLIVFLEKDNKYLELLPKPTDK